MGMIATKVNGTTARMIIAPTSQPIPAPSSHDAVASEKADDGERRLHPCAPLVAGRPNGSRDLGRATHSCGMLDEIDVNRRAGKDNAAQGCHKLSDWQHEQSPPKSLEH